MRTLVLSFFFGAAFLANAQGPAISDVADFQSFEGYANQAEVTLQDDGTVIYQAFVSEHRDPTNRGDEIIVNTEVAAFFPILLRSSGGDVKVEVTYEVVNDRVVPRQIKLLDRDLPPARR